MGNEKSVTIEFFTIQDAINSYLSLQLHNYIANNPDYTIEDITNILDSEKFLPNEIATRLNLQNPNKKSITNIRGEWKKIIIRLLEKIDNHKRLDDLKLENEKLKNELLKDEKNRRQWEEHEKLTGMSLQDVEREFF